MKVKAKRLRSKTKFKTMENKKLKELKENSQLFGLKVKENR